MLRTILFAIKLTIVVGMLFTSVQVADAAWGSFDTSFGFQGAAIDTITGYQPLSVAVQPDGKILVTGYRLPTQLTGARFFLRRYLANGSLDTAFGTNGAATGLETNSFGTDHRGENIVVLPTGVIAVSGAANGVTAVWQFNANGTRDKFFGDNGLLVLNGYGLSYAGMYVQSGKLLLSMGKQVGSEERIVLVRLTSVGALDNHFGRSGESLTGMTATKGSGVVVESTGKITIGGIRYDNLSAKGLERKTSSGQDDTTFAPGTFFSSGIEMSGLAELTNGKYSMRWANLAGNGTLTMYLDKFSQAGFLESSITPINAPDIARCPEIFAGQSDGKLIARLDGLLFRTNNELDGGSLEMTYCTNLNGIIGLSRAALQPDDKMVAAGVYNNYLMLVRLLAN